VWVEHELDPAHPQFARTRREIEAGVLAYSGDAAAAPSAADFDPVSGHIGTWVAAAWSLVKQPAEPALGPVSAKSYVTALKSAFVQQQTAQAEVKAGSPAHEAHEPAQSNAQQTAAGQQYPADWQSPADQQPSVGPVEFEKSSSEGNPMNLLELLAGFFNVEATADAIVPALTAFVAWLGDEPVEDADFSTIDLVAMKAAFELDDEAANADLIPHFEAFKAALVEPPAAAPDYSALAGAARGLVTQQAATPADEAPPAMTPAKSVTGTGSPTIYTSRVQVLGERPSETPLADMILAHRDGNTLAAAKAVGGQVGPQGGYLLNEVTADHLLVEPFYANEVLVQLGVQTERFPGAESFEAPTWRSGARAYWAGQGKKVDESGPEFGKLVGYPKELVSRVLIPNKKLRNAKAILEQTVRKDLDKAFRLEVQRAALYGAGAMPNEAGHSGAEPLGLFNTPGVTITPVAANGADPDLPHLENMIGALEDRDIPDENWGFLAHPSVARGYNNLKDTTKRYILREEASDGPLPTWLSYPYARTTQVRKALDQGTSTGNTSHLFFGKWDEMVIGISQDVELVVDTSRYVNERMTLLQAVTYVDVVVLVPGAFEIRTGIKH
jgi:HK97 family phage major capsid protein